VQAAASRQRASFRAQPRNLTWSSVETPRLRCAPLGVTNAWSRQGDECGEQGDEWVVGRDSTGSGATARADAPTDEAVCVVCRPPLGLGRGELATARQGRLRRLPLQAAAPRQPESIRLQRSPLSDRECSLAGDDNVDIAVTVEIAYRKGACRQRATKVSRRTVYCPRS
jgi:hypothetical protein